MSDSKFRVGDYVRHSDIDFPHVYRVDELEADGLTLVVADMRDGRMAPLRFSHDRCTRVTVHDAKPRRTLTLSAGLEWMRDELNRSDRQLYLMPILFIDGMPSKDPWGVFSNRGDLFMASGLNPLSALIAARKNLKVKK